MSSTGRAGGRYSGSCQMEATTAMVEAAETWHYGLVAKWWAEFNDDGPEIAYFQRFVESGQPALDVACGTGRLLIPYLKAGMDVDGCDVSPDMIALCRENAERAGLSPTLFVQPMHDLDPPRTYRTIFVCGGFGLGSNAGTGCESPTPLLRVPRTRRCTRSRQREPLRHGVSVALLGQRGSGSGSRVIGHDSRRPSDGVVQTAPSTHFSPALSTSIHSSSGRPTRCAQRCG